MLNFINKNRKKSVYTVSEVQIYVFVNGHTKFVIIVALQANISPLKNKMFLFVDTTIEKFKFWKFKKNLKFLDCF